MKSLYSWLYRHEYLLAIILMLAGVAVAQWPILSASNNNMYPQTVDAMGHLTKIKYMADCLRSGNWPSWFPYWYNGSTVIQYYPPLSYIWALPAQLITDNGMVTFKWLAFSSIFFGSMGIWITSRRFVSPWVGIIGGLTYALQPFLNRSLLVSGLVAQVPIFALSPWLIFFTLLYINSGRRTHWLGITLVTSALILSHAMHAFMVVVCCGVLVLVLVLTNYGKNKSLIGWMGAIVCAGGLTAFWSIPGVTGLETPGVPKLLTEAAGLYTATLDWFKLSAKHGSWFYFSLGLLAVSLLALIPGEKATTSLKLNRITIALVISLMFSLWLSFGNRWMLYSYIPFHDSLVPGRILSFSALICSLLISILIFKAYSWTAKNKMMCVLLTLCVTGIVFYDEWPMDNTYHVTNFEQIQSELPFKEGTQFDGRFTWLWRSGSEVTYFPFKNGVMMADGWNVEGTPHNQALWDHNVAISANCDEYVTRNLLQWNVRSIFVANQYSALISNMEKHGFSLVQKGRDKSLLTSTLPSSWVMKLHRNSIVIGRNSSAMAMTFPWLINGNDPCFENYSVNVLENFDLIYITDPEVKDLSLFENQVRQLVERNITVIIEPGRTNSPNFFGTIPYVENNVNKSRLLSNDTRLQITPFQLNGLPDEAPFIGGLDNVILQTDNEGKVGPAAGYKYVGQGKVLFVGLSLSQQLEAFWTKSRGLETRSPNGEAVKTTIGKIMDLASPVKDINPVAIKTEHLTWKADGFSFRYKVNQAQPAWVSVTYTPRWQCTVDGKKQAIYNLENLLLIDLPAGTHEVEFKYGMTWVGKLGMGVTGVSLAAVILFALNPFWFDRLRRKYQGIVISGIRDLFDWR